MPSRKDAPLWKPKNQSYDHRNLHRDLTHYRIQITREADGWHIDYIDYELKNPRSHGGGPHHVVDATTGAILKKRYEQ